MRKTIGSITWTGCSAALDQPPNHPEQDFSPGTHRKERDPIAASSYAARKRPPIGRQSSRERYVPCLRHTRRQIGDVFRIAAEEAEVKRSCLGFFLKHYATPPLLILLCVFVGTLQRSLAVLKVSQHRSSRLARKRVCQSCV